jgi:hypothetical protein
MYYVTLQAEGSKVSLYMKFLVFPIIAVLSACTTYDTQTAAIPETEVLVVAETPADAGVTDVTGAVEDSGETQTAVDKDRIICKRASTTGSRFQKKTCMKWSDWEAMAGQAQSVMQGSQRRGTQGNIDQGG